MCGPGLSCESCFIQADILSLQLLTFRGTVPLATRKHKLMSPTRAYHTSSRHNHAGQTH